MRPSDLVLLLVLALVPTAAAAQLVSPVAPDPVRADTVRADTARPDTVRANTPMRDSASVVRAFDGSPEQAGRRDGRAAGSHGGGVVWRGTTSFLLGVPIGFVGPLGLIGHEPWAVGGAAGATALVVTLGSGHGTVPGRLARAAQERGPEYEQAFRASYGERIAKRRRRAAVIGGVLGSVTGVGLVVAASLLVPIA